MEHSTHSLPGLMTRTEAELRQVFLEQVKAVPAGERIRRCIQCGTCTGSCPVSYAMDISPRQLIALFRAVAEITAKHISKILFMTCFLQRFLEYALVIYKDNACILCKYLL